MVDALDRPALLELDDPVEIRGFKIMCCSSSYLDALTRLASALADRS
jgi:hypothetical protein